MTTPAPMLAVPEPSHAGSVSEPSWTLYQAPTFMEPRPLPAPVVPSAHSVISVQPETVAVMSYGFHVASRMSMSPVVPPAGMG